MTSPARHALAKFRALTADSTLKQTIAANVLSALADHAQFVKETAHVW